MDKALFDKNEQMSNDYILNILKTMMEDIELRIKSKNNNNEFFISQMNANGENNNEENNNIIQPINNNNITYDDTNIAEETLNKKVK